MHTIHNIHTYIHTYSNTIQYPNRSSDPIYQDQGLSEFRNMFQTLRVDVGLDQERTVVYPVECICVGNIHLGNVCLIYIEDRTVQYSNTVLYCTVVELKD